MRIVCVSRGTYGGGKELAEKLAAKLGIPCLAREQVTDMARRAGINVGKLEMSVVRPRPMTESLAIEKERFKAFITATLAERALAGGVVYHGRTGHLVLPSVAHVLRIRAIMAPESRIALTMQRLGLDRDKARLYNEQVDDDRRRWARTLYNVDWDDPSHYDLVLSLDHMSADNAASAAVGVAQLPEFQPTPASEKVLRDLLLAAQCRLAIGSDERTRMIDATVRANNGSVSITYPPRHAANAAYLEQVVAGVPGVARVQCTMASTSILWIEERFDPQSESMTHLLEIAAKWNAAVGLVRLCSQPLPPVRTDDEPLGKGPVDAGILDDSTTGATDGDDGGVRATMSCLLQEGRAGGYWQVCGGARDLTQSLDRTADYSLVVVGNVFQGKDSAVRKRMTRELTTFVGESLRVPAIGADELHQQYLFGPSHWIKMLGLAALSAAMVILVFHFQAPILDFLSRPGLGNRVAAVVVLALAVPLFAQVYGGFSHYFLRLLKFE